VTDSGLPVPETPAESLANKLVEYATVRASTSGNRKRGNYGEYSPATRANIARYALKNGNTKAARHFSSALKQKHK
jgi:hypothetical protein